MVIREVNELLSMPNVARFLGFDPDSKGFIRSPFHKEKTASCKLYSELGRGFYDFSSGTGGDCIRFVSLTQGVDSWTACKLMAEAFNLPISLENSSLTRQKVRELKQQRENDQRRRNLKKQKSVNEMDSLKSTIRICEELLTSTHVEPLSDIWCAAVNRRNMAIIQANEMCGIETLAVDLRLPERPKEREVS
jgi:hypothetical protein